MKKFLCQIDLFIATDIYGRWAIISLATTLSVDIYFNNYSDRCLIIELIFAYIMTEHMMIIYLAIHLVSLMYVP